MLDVKLNLVNKDMNEIIGQITERSSFNQKWLAGVPPPPPPPPPPLYFLFFFFFYDKKKKKKFINKIKINKNNK